MANVTGTLNSSVGLEFIKRCFDKETEHETIDLIIDTALNEGISLCNQIAYILATAKNESDFKPVEEIFAYRKEALQAKWGKTRFSDKWIKDNLTFKKNSRGASVVIKEDWEKVANRAYSNNKRLRNGSEKSGDGYKFRGRGFVQITGRRNYKEFSKILGLNLLEDPDQVLEPSVAAKILAHGMKNGTFTTKKLDNYLTLKKEDYFSAREIVNGLDKAKKFANTAQNYERLLEECKAGIDIAFVIDTTGSMEDDIDRVKDSAVEIINDIFDEDNQQLNSRIGVVGFKDPGQVTGFLDLKAEPSLFQSEFDSPEIRKEEALNAINQISISGGGDIPEGVYSGLLYALDGSIGAWRTDATERRIVLFGDAPPKDGELAADVSRLALGEGVFIEDMTTVSTEDISNSLSRTVLNLSRAETSEPLTIEIFTVVVGDSTEAQTSFQKIADDNLGRAFSAVDANEVVEVLRRAINERDVGIAPSPINFSRKPGLRIQGTRRSDELIGEKKNDLLRGKKGDDLLDGQNGSDRVFGDKGKDSILGGNGRDWLVGGDDKDVLEGGRGNDIIEGGLGKDMLTGNQGRDLFVFNSLADRRDTITDFNGSSDLIDLRAIFGLPEFDGVTAFTQFTQFVELRQAGTKTKILIDGDGSGLGTRFQNLVTLKDVSVNSLSSENFVIR